MGHLVQSFSEHLRGIGQAIASISSSIVDHVTLKRLRGNEDSDEEDDDDDLDSLDIDPFDAVLERVKVKHVGKHVAAIRAKTQPGNKKNIPVVEVGAHKLHGENIYYVVKFADGIKWMLKVPAGETPDQFGEDDAEAFRSEALTMIMLRRETTIPIPKVFAYDNTWTNKLKVPFILMEFIDARPLSDVWHDQESPEEVVQARRTRCLQDIAAAYLQLGKYTFNENTPLRFDDQDRLIGVAPVKEYPFSGLKEAYVSHLDRREGGEENDGFGRGLLKLLRMFADWTPEPSDGKSFVLHHANPNIFNFLVSEDGSVRAILDWHGAGPKLPSIGNEAYPLWLMRDWDPSVYRWSEEMEQGINDEDCYWEDSPDKLEFYRNVYAQCIANLRPESENAKITRNSPLFVHLMMATRGSMFILATSVKIVEEVIKRVEKDADDNSWPPSFSPSNDNNKDDDDSKNLSSTKDQDAAGDHNAPNETKANAEDDDIGADIDGEDEDEPVIMYDLLERVDRDGLSEHQQKVLRTGFDALFVS
ncbi:hypothetical protein LT330_007121 [Penicillium expansum]|nr:hypothetical protein LT330_007121 [Penicillium expansum]